MVEQQCIIRPAIVGGGHLFELGRLANINRALKIQIRAIFVQ